MGLKQNLKCLKKKKKNLQHKSNLELWSFAARNGGPVSKQNSAYQSLIELVHEAEDIRYQQKQTGLKWEADGHPKALVLENKWEEREANWVAVPGLYPVICSEIWKQLTINWNNTLQIVTVRWKIFGGKKCCLLWKFGWCWRHCKEKMLPSSTQISTEFCHPKHLQGF